MKLTLIQDGRTKYAISVRRSASETECFAAEELSRYLEMIAGARIPIETRARGRHVIALGADLRAESPDAFRIRTAGSRLVLSGASPRAVLYAVYTFLEDCLGCGWIRPGDEQVPDLNEIVIGELDILQQPSFRDRILVHFPFHRARALEQIDWMAKRKLNTSFIAINNDVALWDQNQARERVIPELRKRGIELRGIGHSFFAWLPPSKYFAKHPEYYSLIDGKRRSDTSLCVSNPAVAREVARNIGRFADRNPEMRVVSLWHNDLMDWCQCAGCRAMLDTGERSLSFMNAGSDVRRLAAGLSTTAAELAFVNRVAGHLEKNHPGLRIESLAYGPNCNPTRRIEPRPNVLMGLAAFDKCLAPENALTPIYQGPVNQPIARYIRAWRKRARHFYIYEYYGLFHDFTPLLDVMCKDLRFYRRLRVDGISSEIAGWNELHLYAFARLAWDCRLTADELLRRYCRSAYGPVQDTMFEHWDRLRKARLDWNWNSLQIRTARAKTPLPRWFASRRAGARWKKVEADCSALLAKAIAQLQRYPLFIKSPAVLTDHKALGRVRQIRARWEEVPMPWWGAPSE